MLLKSAVYIEIACFFNGKISKKRQSCYQNNSTCGAHPKNDTGDTIQVTGVLVAVVMHQNRLRLGLRPKARWGKLTALPMQTSAGINGTYF